MKSVKKNYIYNVLYQILTIILPLITAPYVARVLGAENTGIYSYTHSIAQYFVILIMLGLNNYGNKYIAAIRDNHEELNKAFNEIYTMQFITGIIFIGAFIVLQLLNCFNDTFYLWLQFPFILSAIFDVNWFFFGTEEFKLTVTRNSVIKILTIIATFAFIKESSDISKYVLLLSSGMLISNLCLWPFLVRKIKVRLAKLSDVKKHFKENIILFIPVIATSIYTVMDKIMIGFMSTMQDVGYYEYSERIKNIPLGLINALGTVMLPRMSNLFAKKEEQEKAIQSINYSMEFILWLSVALAFGISSVSKEFIPLFLGNDYQECIKLTSLLSFAIIFIGYANVIRTQYLIPKSKNKIYVTSSIIGALVNFIVNYFLIKSIGVIGAVIGTLIAELSVALFQTISIYHELAFKRYFMCLTKYLLVGTIMYVINVSLLEALALNYIYMLILKIITGSLVYVILTMLINTFIDKKSIINISILKLSNKH